MVLLQKENRVVVPLVVAPVANANLVAALTAFMLGFVFGSRTEISCRRRMKCCLDV